MTAPPVIVTLAFGIAALLGGALWYKGAERYHEKMRSWLRIDNRNIRQGRRNSRYFGAIFLAVAGLVMIIATIVHVVRLAVG